MLTKEPGSVRKIRTPKCVLCVNRATRDRQSARADINGVDLKPPGGKA
jgi:hypothetical protein